MKCCDKVKTWWAGLSTTQKVVGGVVVFTILSALPVEATNRKSPKKHAKALRSQRSLDDVYAVERYGVA
jgi:hypothetical protein